MGVIASLPLAFCVSRIAVLNTQIHALHTRLTWPNLTDVERHNASWTMIDFMLERYDLLQPNENPI
jgi:hypothetical protein